MLTIIWFLQKLHLCLHNAPLYHVSIVKRPEDERSDLFKIYWTSGSTQSDCYFESWYIAEFFSKKMMQSACFLPMPVKVDVTLGFICSEVKISQQCFKMEFSCTKGQERVTREQIEASFCVASFLFPLERR